MSMYCVWKNFDLKFLKKKTSKYYDKYFKYLISRSYCASCNNLISFFALIHRTEVNFDELFYFISVKKSNMEGKLCLFVCMCVCLCLCLCGLAHMRMSVCLRECMRVSNTHTRCLYVRVSLRVCAWAHMDNGCVCVCARVYVCALVCVCVWWGVVEKA